MILLLLLVYGFLLSSETCQNEGNTCTKPFDEDSLVLSLWRDSSFNKGYKQGEILSIGEWVYVRCEILGQTSYDVGSFHSIIARPIPRQRHRASLLDSRKGGMTSKGEICELEIIELDETKKGFQFRLEKEVFDFRRDKDHEVLQMEMSVIVNILQQEEESVLQVEKLFRMKIAGFDSTIDGDQKKKKIVNIFTPDDNLKGLLSLPSAGNHQYRVSSDDRSASIFWYHYNFQYQKRYETIPSLGNYVAMNHIWNENEYIGKKDRLTRTLRAFPDETSKFYPTTYRITYVVERTAFFSQFVDNDDDQIWMLKASGLSEGKGTRFITKMTGENSRIQMDGKDIRDNNLDESFFLENIYDKDTTYIAQRYISNPLLYEEKYKVGIRQFWLIASIHPLRVLVYDTGFCTFSSSPYTKNADSFADKTVHLTNYDQQPDGSKPEFMYVKDYFAKYHQHGSTTWYEEVFRKQVKNALEKVTRSYWEKSKGIVSREFEEQSVLQFGLYGADFVMDEDEVLWLNEVQRSPSLRHTGKCLKSEFMPEMIVETLDIVSEIRSYSELHGGSSGLKDIKSVRKFEWIINES